MTALEINLLSKSGLTDDSILSVRAGTVRRQALINSGRPFRFPKTSMDGNPIKIDVMQTVGSAYLVLNPNSEQYKVTFDKDSKISAELSVKKVDGSGAEAKEEPAAKEVAMSAKDAKEYLEAHQILQFVQAVLQTVIKDRPTDPYKYMARHFLSGYDQGESKAEVAASPPPPAPMPRSASAFRARFTAISSSAHVISATSSAKANSLLRSSANPRVSSATARE